MITTPQKINLTQINIEPGDQGNKSVNINDCKEVKYWMDRFRKTTAQLRTAVNAVDNTAGDVEAYLQKKDIQR